MKKSKIEIDLLIILTIKIFNMNPLEFLPKELEDIIIDYKTEFENFESGSIIKEVYNKSFENFTFVKDKYYLSHFKYSIYKQLEDKTFVDYFLAFDEMLNYIRIRGQDSELEQKIVMINNTRKQLKKYIKEYQNEFGKILIGHELEDVARYCYGNIYNELYWSL